MTQFWDRVETDILPHVRKPQRYAGRELHRIVKPDAELRFAIAFPDLYEIAMSSLAVQILYHRINSCDPVIAGERVFLPEEDTAARFRATQIPLPTLETRTPLRDVDIIGVSLSYEMALPGMLELLDLGQVPIRREQRRESDPIVIAGGPVVYNPEPFAEFVDLVAVGDGEEFAVEIAKTALQCKRSGYSREQTVDRLADLNGMYRPSLHTPIEGKNGRFFVEHGANPLVQGQLVEQLRPEYYPDTPLVPLTETTFDRLSLEVMRGCTRGCRFCQAGTLYRPVRERPMEDVVAQAIANVRATGHNELSLTSLSTSDYSPLPELINALQDEFAGKGISLAFPSLRPDSFTREMAHAFPGSRKSGITFAPEAGTQRLRDVINKNSREEDLLRAAELAFSEGYNSVKLYFMIGLPTETDEDLFGIAKLAHQVTKLRTSKRQRVTVSVSPFAPKAHTPFQRFGQVPVEEVHRRIDVLRRSFRDVQARLSTHGPESALIETCIARGDRRMGNVIERVWKDGGVLEAWNDRFDAERWWQAFRDADLDPNQLASEFVPGEKLPWGHVSKGVHDRFHDREMHKAMRVRTTVDCRVGQCHGCGLQKMIPDGELVCNLYPDVTRMAPQPVAETPAPSDVTVVARVRYTRGPELRWSGHLDFVRLWERLLRRAGIPIAYSQGFHPHARLGFGPPLPVGLQSDAEYFDISLYRPMEADEIVSSINRYAPGGIRAERATVLQKRPAALTSIVERVLYGFPAPETDTFQSHLEAFLEQESFTINRLSKGKVKRVDLRRFVHRVNQGNGLVELHLDVFNGATARLDELAEAWDAPPEFLTTVTRKEIFSRDGDTLLTPMELLDDARTQAPEVTA
ncbi:TIGR03960 family B12-binding radical SAM protein [bacterium]|nr:TIGR03960 family B12-binding radical SAM protein [bacterium]